MACIVPVSHSTSPQAQSKTSPTASPVSLILPMMIQLILDCPHMPCITITLQTSSTLLWWHPQIKTPLHLHNSCFWWLWWQIHLSCLHPCTVDQLSHPNLRPHIPIQHLGQVWVFLPQTLSESPTWWPTSKLLHVRLCCQHMERGGQPPLFLLLPRPFVSNIPNQHWLPALSRHCFTQHLLFWCLQWTVPISIPSNNTILTNILKFPTTTFLPTGTDTIGARLVSCRPHHPISSAHSYHNQPILASPTKPLQQFDLLHQRWPFSSTFNVLWLKYCHFWAKNRVIW